MKREWRRAAIGVDSAGPAEVWGKTAPSGSGDGSLEA